MPPAAACVTVKEIAGERNEDAKYLANVHVKVIGSSNSAFTSGETDLRGVFIADSIVGTSTVIAQAESGQYAFFRGKTQLGPVAANTPAQAGEPASSEKGKATDGKDLLKNVYQGQIDASRFNSIKLQQLYDNSARGVQVEQAK